MAATRRHHPDRRERFRNTARGVVRDTKHNTEKVGEGMEHVGEKITDSTR